jgi:transketolase
MDATMRHQAAITATDLFRRDPRVAIVLSEISTDYFRKAFAHDPARTVNVGIMEQTMIGVAAGFAMEGFLPVVHTIGPFLAERPLEQVKLDFGYQGLEGTFIPVGGSHDYTAEGFTHHTPGDVAVMRTVPGMQVLVPGTAAELARLFEATYANGHPTYLRTSTQTNDRSFEVEVGRLEVVARGARGTVVAVGPMLERTLAATEGLDLTVLYAMSVEPFDADGLAREAADADDLAAPDLEVDVVEARRRREVLEPANDLVPHPGGAVGLGEDALDPTTEH